MSWPRILFETIFKKKLQINHDLTERAKFLAALFKTLKLHHMSRSFLVHHVRKHKLIDQNEHCKELVMTTYEHLLMPNDESVKLHQTPKRNPPDESELTFSQPEDIEPGKKMGDLYLTICHFVSCNILKL